jgi:hypothetical protein
MAVEKITCCCLITDHFFENFMNTNLEIINNALVYLKYIFQFISISNKLHCLLARFHLVYVRIIYENSHGNFCRLIDI